MSIEVTLDGFREVLVSAEERINHCLGNGERLTVTALSRELGDQFGMDKQAVYHLLSAYTHNRADITTKLGKDGGFVWADQEAERKVTAAQRNEERKAKSVARLEKKLADLSPEVLEAALAKVRAASNPQG